LKTNIWPQDISFCLLLIGAKCSFHKKLKKENEEHISVQRTFL
jgi:hypothetical protein